MRSFVPYAVAAAWPVDDVRAAERDAHAALARYRVSDQREWFRVSLPQAVAALRPSRGPSRARRVWRIVRGIVEAVGWAGIVATAWALTVT